MNRHTDTFVAMQKPPVFSVYYFRKIKELPILSKLYALPGCINRNMLHFWVEFSFCLKQVERKRNNTLS